VLSRLFRRRFLEELQQLPVLGQLKFFGEHTGLADAAAFNDWLAPLRTIEWVVYAKRPFAGPQVVLAYLTGAFAAVSSLEAYATPAHQQSGPATACALGQVGVAQALSQPVRLNGQEWPLATVRFPTRPSLAIGSGHKRRQQRRELCPRTQVGFPRLAVARSSS
jgi:hypothetical protein